MLVAIPIDSRGITSALKNKKDFKPHHITVHNLPSTVLSSCTSQFLKEMSLENWLPCLFLFPMLWNLAALFF